MPASRAARGSVVPSPPRTIRSSPSSSARRPRRRRPRRRRSPCLGVGDHVRTTPRRHHSDPADVSVTTPGPGGGGTRRCPSARARATPPRPARAPPRLRLRGDLVHDTAMDVRVAHDAPLPTSAGPASNCGFTATACQPGAAQAGAGGNALSRPMKDTSQVETSAGTEARRWRMRTFVRSRTVTRVVAGWVELAVADVERGHARRLPGEGSRRSPGRGADVETVLAVTSIEASSACASFSPPRRRTAPSASSSSVPSSTCSPAFACPFTRPARTSACACERAQRAHARRAARPGASSGSRRERTVNRRRTVTNADDHPGRSSVTIVVQGALARPRRSSRSSAKRP